jgi:hypothetical protein
VNDAHGGGRGEVVGVDGFEEVVGEAWELGVELELNAGGEEGVALEEAFDIGVDAGEVLDAEAAGDLGKLAGELLGHGLEVAEFTVVVAEQPAIHSR